MNDWKPFLDDAASCRPLRGVAENWTLRTDYAPLRPEPTIEPETDRLTQLASLLGLITWAEMTELGGGICRTGEVTLVELPAALHLWAMERHHVG